MSQKTSKCLSDAIANLKSTEKELLQLGKLMLSADDGKLFPVDLIAIGAMKRTASNTEGFIGLVEAQNMTSARSLLRVQLDTFMRFSAIWLVDSPHDFAHEIIGGKHIRNIKDRAGNKMTDSYLVETLSKEYPWIKNVYDNLSGYIHFSAQHLFNAVEKVDDDTRTLSLVIGKEDQKYPEWSWIETVDCFTESVNIFFHYLKGWIATKNV
ncbi:hypothetical protein PGH07_03330 [Sulfurovum sp. zt1-1]|uniref:Uncharacterized protein n=1 Tax=Sulfurovum zhangzhouensis TaxID=3019067 RepID=A0ABT7QWJ2_9BACT|nr:hypothetical protein [Sulfurovum zhangzhouensis]MDM5271199.1 hypothetical protein [Sulfurovum zhangzhouensis]